MLVQHRYTVEVRAIGRASLLAHVRDQHDTLVGDLQYRDAQDEPEDYAQGVSYTPFIENGISLRLVQRVLKG
jgi:hypothetical protein